MMLSPHSCQRRRSSIAPRDPSRGGAAVEFALVLPIFLLLVMGTVDYGFYFFSDQVVASAAREGARAGSMDAYPNAENTATQAAQNYMDSNGVHCPGGGSGCITAKADQYTVPGSTTPLTMNRITVTITYPFTSLTGYSSVVVPKNVNGYAQMAW